jgi:nucleoside-diphosphate-sugar epimerase
VKITVIGARGFIGSHIVAKLKMYQIPCFAPERDDSAVFTTPLGTVIYCAGLTADYRKRPFDTVHAHVTLLSDLLEKANFESFIYLSSTRVYYAGNLGEEKANLIVNPNEPEYLFNISKLMGESLCLSQLSRDIRIVRIANVYGDDYSSDNFLFSIIRDAVDKGEIVLQTTLDSEKDYVNVHDVSEILIKIARQGTARLYNIASGMNLTHKALVERIQELTGCRVIVEDGAPEIKFPVINIDNIRDDFAFRPQNLLDVLDDLVIEYKKIAKK